MAKAGALSRFTSLFKGFKAPWAITGPVSSPEYMTHIIMANEYRRFAPTNPPVRPVIPQAESDMVYNIQYFSRDTRRAHMPGGTSKIMRSRYETGAPDAALEAVVGPALPQPTYRWKTGFQPILDHSNNGYTL